MNWKRKFILGEQKAVLKMSSTWIKMLSGSSGRTKVFSRSTEVVEHKEIYEVEAATQRHVE